MSDDQEENEKVGYKRPPAANRFRPGQSGNPKGRPRGARNFASIVGKVMKTMTAVSIKGKKKTMRADEAALLQLRKAVAEGDLKALALFLKIAAQHDDSSAPAAVTPSREEDEALIANYINRKRAEAPNAILDDDPGSEEQ